MQQTKEDIKAYTREEVEIALDTAAFYFMPLIAEAYIIKEFIDEFRKVLDGKESIHDVL